MPRGPGSAGGKAPPRVTRSHGGGGGLAPQAPGLGDRQRIAQHLHAHAVRLYHAGKHQEAMALNERARVIAGLGPTQSAGIVGNVIEQAGKDLASAAVHSPGGIYLAGSDIYRDVGSAVHGHPGFKRTRGLAVQIAKATAADIRHPLRHPGFTALDLAALAVPAGRIAEAGAALKAGDVGAAARQLTPLVKKPVAPRTLRVGETTVHPLASRNPAWRQLQRAHDVTIQRAPALRGALTRRVGFEAEQARRVHEAIERAPAAGLSAMGKKLSLPQQMALRAKAEETPIATRIEFHRNQIKALDRKHTPRAALERRRHAGKIRQLREAQQFIGPNLKLHPDLQPIYEKADAVAHNREEILAKLGLPVSRERISQPGRIARGQPLQENMRPGFAGVETTARRMPVEQARQQLRVADRALERANRDAARAFQRRARLAPRGTADAERLRTRLADENDKLAELQRQGRGLATQHDLVGRVGRRYERTVRALDEAKQAGVRVAAAGNRRREIAASVGLKESHVGTIAGPVRPKFFTAGPEAFRVPHVARRSPSSLGRHGAVGSAGSIGVPRLPGSVTHEFTGALYRAGRTHEQVTRLVAESNIEAQRYGALLRIRDELKGAAKPAPTDLKHDIVIRLDALKKGERMPSAVRDLVMREEQGGKLTGPERWAVVNHIDQLRQDLFAPLTPEEEANFKSLYEQGKIGWVDRRLLRKLDKPAPLSGLRGSTAGKVVAAPFTTINQASKMAILYLKPAYAIPNIGGNAFLNLIQQGPAAPANVARAVKLSRTIGADDTAAVDALVGEGIARALAGGGHLGQAAIEKAAAWWSKPVDVPFRRASWLFEARRAGFRNAESIQRLLHDEALRPQLVEVTRRANASIIDYGRLGPMERDIVRHVIFFYPWVKGSTLYAGHLLREHPIQAALLAQLGVQGKKRAAAELGPLPSYLEGVFKVGGSALRPLVVNPASTSVLGTPAQVVQTIMGLAESNPPAAANFLQQLTPALGAIVEGITKRNPLTGAPEKGSTLGIAGRSLVSGLPQVSLYQRLRGESKSKLYRRGTGQSIGQFLGGSLVPSTLVREQANQLGLREQRAGLSSGARAALKAGDARKTQNVHLDNLVKKGVIPKAQRGEFREALDMYDRRNALNTTIDAATKAKPLERERQKMAALISLLERHRVKPPEGRSWDWFRHAYATKATNPKDIQDDRAKLWDYAGVGPIVTFYRDKAGAND